MDATPDPDDDVVLGGGQMNRVVREGDAVRREGGPWTPTVHRYLDYLRRAGIEWVARPLSYDGVHERLSFLPGSVPAYPLPDWVWSDDILSDGARHLRLLHDASLGFSPDGATWQAPSKIPAEVVCHNDFAPHNLVFESARIVGLIDVDFCSPGPRLWDLAYFATRIVPLTAATPRNAPAMTDARRRVQLILDAYGSSHGVDDVRRVAVIRLLDLAEFADRKAVELGKDTLRDDAVAYRRDAEFLSTWVPTVATSADPEGRAG